MAAIQSSNHVLARALVRHAAVVERAPDAPSAGPWGRDQATHRGEGVMLRPSYFIFAGIVISALGRGKARLLFEVAGTLVIVVGIVDMVLHGGGH
jgi:hypothetical protein